MCTQILIFFWYFGPSARISPICGCNCGRTIHLLFIGDRLGIFCFLSSTARPHWTCLEFRGDERLPQEEHYRIHLGAIQISSFLDPPPKRPRQQWYDISLARLPKKREKMMRKKFYFERDCLKNQFFTVWSRILRKRFVGVWLYEEMFNSVQIRGKQRKQK